MARVSDTRVVAYEPLLSPAALLDELPLDEAGRAGGANPGPRSAAVLEEPMTGCWW